MNNLKILNNFPIKLCLTTSDRLDRQEQTTKLLSSVGIEFEFFQAVDGDDPKDSFNKSQYAIMRMLNGMEKHSLLFEDDIDFMGSDAHVMHALEQVPADWDILYFGANLTNGQPELVPSPGKRYEIMSLDLMGQYSVITVSFHPNIVRVRHAWTTHCVAYSPRAIKYISENYRPTMGMYDDWLATVALQDLNGYCVYPIIAIQRPSQSGLWGTFADYRDCFYESNEIIRRLWKRF